MQKSEQATAVKYFDEALELTRRMRLLLSGNCDMEELGQMYDQRGEILAELQHVRGVLTSPEMVELWNKYTAQLVEADRELLSALEIVKDMYQEKVRQSNQQKYLLIYSKGQQYGY